MQTIEKALHQPMPFTTGGQTISDRLTAAKHSLAGSQLGKTICKATTEEVMAPKKKHLDYLLHCTNEPNVSVPSMANLLIERTQNPNWTVVYKALITIHNIMCYGNERFSQYLASCNTTFNLTAFVDKNCAASGYDMSTHVRRYAKYISEKINTYRMCAFDFCKVKRGREDGLLRTMHTDKLLKTIPILQNQIDALLEFQVSSSELNNGVINCSFILLFRDLIRLFACYNDGIINVLEKYFDMHKKQCRDALDTYKSFLTRLDKVAEFLRVAESVGIDRGEIPDLTRAPASLLEALEAHLIQMEGGRAPAPIHNQQVQQHVASFSFSQQPNVAEAERQRYVDLENARLSQYREEQEQKKSLTSANPFASDVAAPQSSGTVAPATADLLDWNGPAAGSSDTNPFAAITNQPTYQNTSVAPNVNYGLPPNGANSQPPFFGNIHQTNEIGENPFAMASAQPIHHAPAPPVPPPPSSASMAAAHQAAAPINPFADQIDATSQMPFGQAPPVEQGHPFAQFNPNQPEDLARFSQQVSLNQQSGPWNQTSAANNPFSAPQPGYSTAMGAYPQQFIQQPVWQMPYQQSQFSYQPGQLPAQQQQQINLVNQIKQQQHQQQQAQAAVNANDPFGS